MPMAGTEEVDKEGEDWNWPATVATHPSEDQSANNKAFMCHHDQFGLIDMHNSLQLNSRCITVRLFSIR